MVSLSENGKAALNALLKSTARKAKVPACYMGAVTAEEMLYFGYGGDRIYGETEQGHVDENTQLQLLSATKLVTIIACLQLQDRGLLSLDDPLMIEKHLPELWSQPVLDGYDAEGKEVKHKRKSPLTLRHLLSHTSGVGYPYNSPNLERWIREHEHPNWFVTDAGISPLVMPLMFEPGSGWKFSLGIDWAGVLVTRVSERTLDAYFQECIFEPLKIDGFSFYPTDGVKKSLQPLCVLDNGKLRVDTEEFKPRAWDSERIGLQSGGAGLFGTAKGYLRFLQGVLASRNGKGLISPKSFQELFHSALRSHGDDNDQHADLAEFATEAGVYDPLHLANAGQFVDFGPGLLVNTKDSLFGRRAGTACGDGAARTQYFIDPTTGIAGLCFTQLLAFPPTDWAEVCIEFERTLYGGIQPS